MGFSDRTDAGRRLAAALSAYQGQHPVVLALPRGGVPVGAEVARALNGTLDLAFVRKIGVPAQPELAMGAVAEGDEPVVVRNESVIQRAGVTDAAFEAICAEELAEIDRRRQCYRGARTRADIAGKVVIVVDDGIATGATMKAALRAIRRRGPKELILAVPVAPADAIDELRGEVDALISLDSPAVLDAIGCFYDDFHQVSDDDVVATLARFPTGSRNPAD